MTDPLTALRDVPAPPLDATPVHARIDELIAAGVQPRPRRRAPALALLAAGAAAGAVVLTTGGTPTGTRPAAATAATVLHALGKRAVATPPVRLGENEYYAVRIHQYRASGMARDVDIRSWSHDGKGRELSLVDGQVKRDISLERSRDGFLALPDLSTFPTEPEALAARMREEAMKTQLHPGTEPTARDYIGTAMSMFFGAQEIPPDVLRATYDFLAGLPGMRLIGDVTDPLGRPGKAVAVDGDPDTQEGIGIELILDPDDGLPLAYVHYRDGNVDDPWLFTTREAAVVEGTTALP